MMLDPQRKYGQYDINGVPSDFSRALHDIKVSSHAFHTAFEPYKNSWGTMVTSQTPRNNWGTIVPSQTPSSAAKETSLLTSSHFL